MYSLGFDIGGTKCAVILGADKLPQNADAFIKDKLVFPTETARGWEAIVGELITSADRLLKKNGIEKPERELVGIGISCGGPLDSKKGVINSPPNLPGWDDVPIVELFQKHFGVKCFLQNDANACACAEWKFGAGKGLDNIIFLTFGTGMGAGLILNGRLYSGSCDLAGEVGHIRLSEDGPEGYGKKGSFEGYCSGAGIAKIAGQQLSKLKQEGKSSSLFSLELSAKNIAEQAKKGDEAALEIYRLCAEKLGLALSLLIDILNPEAIIIGSIYSRDRELFDTVINDIIKKEALAKSAAACKILPAQLADSIGDFAALSLAFS